MTVGNNISPEEFQQFVTIPAVSMKMFKKPKEPEPLEIKWGLLDGAIRQSVEQRIEKIPLMNNRDFVAESQFLTTDERFVHCLQSPENELELQPLPAKGYTRGELACGGWNVFKKDNELQCAFQTKTDPKNIPKSLVDLGKKDVVASVNVLKDLIETQFAYYMEKQRPEFKKGSSQNNVKEEDDAVSTQESLDMNEVDQKMNRRATLMPNKANDSAVSIQDQLSLEETELSQTKKDQLTKMFSDFNSL